MLKLIGWVGLMLTIALFVFKGPELPIPSEDFNAFYCASKILAQGNNPYLYEPLRTCEHENLQSALKTSVVPSPLPPYALTILRPLTWLPYPQAARLWFLLLVGGSFATVWAVVELTGFPLLIVAFAVLPSVFFQSMESGAIAAISIATLSVAALFVRRQRWLSAAILLGLSCLEPHVALPAVVSTLLLAPPMRRALLPALAILAIMTVAPAGWSLNVEYLARVVPAHASSELGAQWQYGLSSALNMLGLSPHVALLVGSLQYFAFVVLSIWIARRLKVTAPEGIVLLPMALAVIGGPFIHETQIAATIPLAFVLCAQLRTFVGYVALVVLATPWNRILIGHGPPRYSETVTSPSALAESAWRSLAQQTPANGLDILAMAVVYVGFLALGLAISMMIGQAARRKLRSGN